MDQRFNADEPVRKVVDSTVAIAFARLFMPAALAVIGWFLVTTVNDVKQEIRDGNAAVWNAVKAVQVTVSGQMTDIAVLKQSTNVTSKAIDRLTSIVDSLAMQKREDRKN